MVKFSRQRVGFPLVALQELGGHFQFMPPSCHTVVTMASAPAQRTKRPTRERIVKSTGEPFDVFLKRVLAVPKKEIDRKQAAYERAKAKTKKTR